MFRYGCVDVVWSLVETMACSRVAVTAGRGVQLPGGFGSHVSGYMFLFRTGHKHTRHTDDVECETELSQTAISANFPVNKPKFPKCKSLQHINVSYQNMGS